MLSIIESFESMNINKKRVRSERYENVQEIDNLFKSIKISNNSDEEADDEDECGDSDDDSTIRHEEEYQELIKYWNINNIDNTEDIDYPDPEKEVYGYETLYEGFYDSDGKDEFDYWTSDNDFNDND